MNENKIAHLGFIETTIERMANNSAAIKGWSMGIVAAILGVGIISGDKLTQYRWLFFVCALLMSLVMWGLDTFYLYQEKLYRNLYSLIKDKKDDEVDYSMDARYKTIEKMGKKPMKYIRVLINRTIWPFYSTQIIVFFIFFILPIFINA